MTKLILQLRIVLAFVLLIGATNISYSKSDEVILLEAQLNDATSLEDRFELMMKLSFVLRRTSPVKGIEYAEEAYEIAQQENNREWITECLIAFSTNSCFMGKKTDALNYADEALVLAHKDNYEDLIANAYHIKGLTYFFMGMDKKAVKHYHKALEINEKLGRTERAFMQLNNLSLVYRDIKRYDMALEFLERCDALVDLIEGENKYKTFVNFNKGYVYLHMKEYDKALKHVMEATKVNEHWNDTVDIAISYNTIAVIKNEMGFYEEAKEYAQKSLDFAKTIGMKESEIYAIHTISEADNRLGDFENAISGSTMALNLSDTFQSKRYIEGILETLVSSHRSVGEYELAIRYQDRLLEYRDSMFNLEKQHMLDDLDIAYITREKEEENQLLRHENEEIAHVVTLQKKYNLLSIGFGLLFLVLSATLFLALKSRKKNNKKLEAAIDKRTKELVDKNEALQISNRELERFAHVASHDLKEPLRNISSFANLIRRRISSTDDQDLKEYTTFIINGTKQMDNLVQSILSFARLSDNVEYEFSYVNMEEIASQIKAHLSLKIQERNVQLNIAPLPERVFGNSDLLLLLIKNLIENGIKYNEQEQPIINVHAIEHEGSFQFVVQDNGIGIEEEYFKKIFGMFTRLHNRMQYQGSGMGLSICKKIVTQHKGNIWVTSKVGEGSTFTFTIPKRVIASDSIHSSEKILESVEV